MNKNSLVILDKNRIISASNFQIRIYDSKKLIKTIPSYLIQDVVLHIDNNIKPSFLKLCSKLKIPIHFINKNGKYYGSYFNGNSKNILLREAQYNRRLDSNFVLNLSLNIVIGKRNSQLWVLKSIDRKLDLPNINLNNSLNNSYSKNIILGIEGTIAQSYWSKFGLLIKNKDFTFYNRVKNPPRDEINSLLSYGYVLLLSKIITNLLIVGLDPFMGFYHETNYRRPSLALDMMEEFRPIAVDKFVLNLINNRRIKKEDFENYYGVYFLKKGPRLFFIKEWLNWWYKKQFYVKKMRERLTLNELSLYQIRILAKTLVGEIENYIPLNIRGSA